MSEAYLKLEMPESCENCRLQAVESAGIDEWYSYCFVFAGKNYVDCVCPEDGKRDDCPLMTEEQVFDRIVVRCKDCISYDLKRYFCASDETTELPTHYCSYGERKEGG